MDSAQSGNLPEVRITFRIFAPGLDPEEITRNLEVNPDHQHYQGERSKPERAAYKHGMWSLKSKIDPHLSLEEHLQSIIETVDAKRAYIKVLSETTTVDFYCILENDTAFVLSPQILADMTSLGAAFGIAIIPPKYETREEK